MRMPAIMTCEECPVRRYATFCNLEANARRRLESAAHVMPYPAAATLLVEGEPARGSEGPAEWQGSEIRNRERTYPDRERGGAQTLAIASRAGGGGHVVHQPFTVAV